MPSLAVAIGSESWAELTIPLANFSLVRSGWLDDVNPSPAESLVGASSVSCLAHFVVAVGHALASPQVAVGVVVEPWSWGVNCDFLGLELPWLTFSSAGLVHALAVAIVSVATAGLSVPLADRSVVDRG